MEDPSTPVQAAAAPTVTPETITRSELDSGAASSPAPTSFRFTYPAREVLEQINLRIQSELGHLRQAAQACFHAINDPGGNSPTTVTATAGEKTASVTVSQSDG